MRWLINKYKHNKKNVLFFIVGNFIAITFVSVGISSINQMKFLASEKNDGIPENTRVLGVSLQKKIKISDVEKMVREFPREGYYKIVNQSIYVSKGDKRIGSPLHIVFGEHKEDSLRVLEGKDGNKLVGKKLKKHIDKDNYISLYGERIKVDGIIGGTEELSKWDSRIILDINQIPERNQRSIENGNFQLYVESKNENVDIIVEEIEKIIHKNGYPNAIISSSLLQTDEMHLEDYKAYSSESMKDIGIVYLISIINLIFITNRWIYGLRNEIGVMKCMGIKEGTIIKRIFLEYLIVVFISLILSLGFQQLLYKIILGFDIIYFKVTISNLILGGGIAIVTSVLVLLNPIRKIINQSPIKLLGR